MKIQPTNSEVEDQDLPELIQILSNLERRAREVAKKKGRPPTHPRATGGDEERWYVETGY